MWHIDKMTRDLVHGYIPERFPEGWDQQVRWEVSLNLCAAKAEDLAEEYALSQPQVTRVFWALLRFYGFREKPDRGGRRSLQYAKWRRKVLKRDKYACQNCAAKGVSLNAHHIEGYAQHPTLRTEVDNGVTLCEICHKNFHKKYGRGNNTSEQFMEWLGKLSIM